MASLTDWLGKAVKQMTLNKMVATPSRSGVRSVISDHPADGLTPRKLARIVKEAADGEPLAYFELAEDIEERDPHYLAVLSTRKRSVSQLPITVTPVSDDANHKKHAEFVQSWIDDQVLEACLFDMLDAVGKGMSVLEIDWQFHGDHQCPREFIWRDPRWFTFDLDDGETVLLRDGKDGEPLIPHKFVIHRHKSKSGLTVRGGIARVALWSWMYKAFTVRDWAMFCQNYGMPIRIGKYGQNASEDEMNTLWKAVRTIAGDRAAIMPAGMEIDFVEVSAKGTSSDLYERRANFFNLEVSKLVLGQTTTTDAVSGGHAVAQEHRLVQEDIERADARMISATVNQQIIPNMVAFNFGPQDYYPKVSIGRPDEVPLNVFADAFDKMAGHGLTADASWVRTRMGIPPPKDGDENIGGRPIQNEPPAVSQHIRQLMQHRGHHIPDLADRLTERLSRETAGAMAGLTDEIRAVFMESDNLVEAGERLAAMQLDPDALSDAMARGLALSHLAGQAALIEEIEQET